jgi:hypothetical protein
MTGQFKRQKIRAFTRKNHNQKINNRQKRSLSSIKRAAKILNSQQKLKVTNHQLEHNQ